MCDFLHFFVIFVFLAFFCIFCFGVLGGFLAILFMSSFCLPVHICTHRVHGQLPPASPVIGTSLEGPSCFVFDRALVQRLQKEVQRQKKLPPAEHRTRDQQSEGEVHIIPRVSQLRPDGIWVAGGIHSPQII